MSGSEALEELGHQQLRHGVHRPADARHGRAGHGLADEKEPPGNAGRGHHRVWDGGEREEGARPRGGRFPAQAALPGVDHRERRARAAGAGRDHGGDQAVRAGADLPGRDDRGGRRRWPCRRRRSKRARASRRTWRSFLPRPSSAWPTSWRFRSSGSMRSASTGTRPSPARKVTGAPERGARPRTSRLTGGTRQVGWSSSRHQRATTFRCPVDVGPDRRRGGAQVRNSSRSPPRRPRRVGSPRAAAAPLADAGLERGRSSCSGTRRVPLRAGGRRRRSARRGRT